MRECLEYETSLNEATQDRIFELMELQDLNTEAEEKEDEESLAEHSQLRIQIASVESAVRAGREIRDKINSLAERETLHGRFVKGQLDDIKSHLSQLYALWDGAENSEEVKTLVHELKADFTRLNRHFADEEPDTSSESTLSDKSITITRDAVRLPHLELPTFEGDPLQWKTFWEDFESVLGKAPHLTDADQLRYLRTAVKSKEGQAIISTTSIDGDGYGDVVLQLRWRYD